MVLHRFEDGLMYLERALSQPISSKFQSITFLNYVEGLRVLGRLEQAKNSAERFLKMIKFHHPEDFAAMHFHLAKIESALGNTEKAADSFVNCLSTDVNHKDCWKKLCELLLEEGKHEIALRYARGAFEIFPNDSSILHLYGLTFHHLKRVDEALQVYRHAMLLDPQNTFVKVSIAAALQGLGRSEEALTMYSELLQLLPNDAAMMNNLGALLGTMNRHDEEIYWLLRALEINPKLEQALTNIAGFYQDEGLLDDASAFLSRIPLRNSRHGLLIALRIATMMSPVSASWDHMITERNEMERRILAIIEDNRGLEAKAELDSSFDRIHFYISFHGLNDKYMQQLIATAYQNVLLEANWKLPNIDNSTLHQFLVSGLEPVSFEVVQAFERPSKKRIGFVSKFFGIFEPHGMLLDGAMKYLPRDHFEVICLPVARSDGKPVASILSETCDEIVHISLIHHHALAVLATMNLDVLVFADFVSEPINHFLAFARMAPVQVSYNGYWNYSVVDLI
jgi:tetratricopeptide (TPR) repeat protein